MKIKKITKFKPSKISKTALMFAYETGFHHAVEDAEDWFYESHEAYWEDISDYIYGRYAYKCGHCKNISDNKDNFCSECGYVMLDDSEEE